MLILPIKLSTKNVINIKQCYLDRASSGVTSANILAAKTDTNARVQLIFAAAISFLEYWTIHTLISARGSTRGVNTPTSKQPFILQRATYLHNKIQGIFSSSRNINKVVEYLYTLFNGISKTKTLITFCEISAGKPTIIWF